MSCAQMCWKHCVLCLRLLLILHRLHCVRGVCSYSAPNIDMWHIIISMSSHWNRNISDCIGIVHPCRGNQSDQRNLSQGSTGLSLPSIHLADQMSKSLAATKLPHASNTVSRQETLDAAQNDAQLVVKLGHAKQMSDVCD